MEWLLVAIIAIVCTATTLACILALSARNRFHRHHRVDPAVATDAPLSWLVDPRTPAKLHRRLAKVGTSTTAVADDHRPTGRKARKAEPSPLIVTATDVRAQAVLLDRQVARLATLAPAARRGPLHELSHAVAEVEGAAVRLVALSARVRTPQGLRTDDSALADITARVDRLAEAHQELLDLDHDNGLASRPLPAPPLVRPQPAPTQTQPQPQTWPPSPQR